MSADSKEETPQDPKAAAEKGTATRGGPQSDSSEAAAPSHDGRIMDHEYDGIREYDNPLPGWWVATFWLTFLFSVGYFFHYHLSGRGVSIHEAYAEELKRHEAFIARRAAKEKVTEKSLETLMGTATALAAGQKIFAARCEACHAAQGQGLVGPNLTDDHWIQGQGALMDIYQVVHDGVAAKGMPAWSRQLTPMELRQVVVFAGTLRGKNVPGKASEGKPVGGPPADAEAEQGKPAAPGAQQDKEQPAQAPPKPRADEEQPAEATAVPGASAAKAAVPKTGRGPIPERPEPAPVAPSSSAQKSRASSETAPPPAPPRGKETEAVKQPGGDMDAPKSSSAERGEVPALPKDSPGADP